LVFFTNYHSRKGSQLAANPAISAVFFWPELERQVNVEGKVSKCTAEYSDAYFQTRPWKSKIGARISPQSQPIESRTYLKSLFVQESAKFLLGEVPRPDHWGGYQIEPHRIEFWQGRPSRLHDRILFSKTGENAWKIQRLAP
jgi:pyridoxamine 5'-phosphate oxidase